MQHGEADHARIHAFKRLVDVLLPHGDAVDDAAVLMSQEGRQLHHPPFLFLQLANSTTAFDDDLTQWEIGGDFDEQLEGDLVHHVGGDDFARLRQHFDGDVLQSRIRFVFGLIQVHGMEFSGRQNRGNV